MNFLNITYKDTNMLTSNFKNIDVNNIATDRQTYGVACHFANIHAASPSERYGLTKVFNAVIKKYYSDADSFMTHGDVSEFRAVPADDYRQETNQEAKGFKES